MMKSVFPDETPSADWRAFSKCPTSTNWASSNCATSGFSRSPLQNSHAWVEKAKPAKPTTAIKKTMRRVEFIMQPRVARVGSINVYYGRRERESATAKLKTLTTEAQRHREEMQ